MEVLCRLSYSSDGPMIATAVGPPSCDHGSDATSLLLAALALAACASESQVEPSPVAGAPTHEVVFRMPGGDRSLFVRAADSDGERAYGLMHVRDLPAEEGMAFVFPEPTTGGFWMKDAVIPLSIAFVGEDGRIVTISEMEPCPLEDCPSYGASAPYTLAVEANAGWLEERDVTEGDETVLLEAG